MEPAAEMNGKSAPLAVWSTDSPLTPIKSPTNNNEREEPEGVKFLDQDGRIVVIDRDDSICSSGSSSEEERKEHVYPDGGWGWVVVMSSLVISMIADGISFSFGLVYTEFLKHFGESKAKTSWIGSLFMAVPLLSGPIMSALVDRYGCKWMTILGGIISGLGFVGACFCETIECEYMTFGFIAGLGLGLCYVTAVVSICFWFDKYRTTASGLGACGTGLGTFVYTPMTQYFIDTYGWRGTVLLLAGTFLNMCVCGAVMRDPEWYTEEKNAQSVAGTKSIRNASSCGSVSMAESTFPGPEEIRNMIKSGKSPDYILTTLAMSVANPEAKQEETASNDNLSHSVVNLPTYLRENETVPLEVIQQLSGNKRLFNVILENYPTLLRSRSASDEGKLHQIPQSPSVKKAKPLDMSFRLKKKSQEPTVATVTEVASEEDLDYTESPLLPIHETMPVIVNGGLVSNSKPQKVMPPFKRQTSLRDRQHYLNHIKVHRNSVMYRGGAMLNLPRYHLRASSCPNIYRNSMTTLAKDEKQFWYTDVIEIFKGIFDFSMFLELHFFFLSFATILLFTMFIVPYFYLPEHMRGNGYTEQDASVLLSAIGIANCLGMIGLGWLGDQPYVNVPWAFAGCMLGCGFTCIMMPLVTHNYYALGTFGILFGLLFASTYSFTPTILSSLIPIERFTTGYGLILLCQGIGNLLGPPLAGFIFDTMQKWDHAFYQAGIWIIVCGCFISLISFTENRRIYGNAPLEMDRVSLA